MPVITKQNDHICTIILQLTKLDLESPEIFDHIMRVFFPEHNINKGALFKHLLSP